MKMLVKIEKGVIIYSDIFLKCYNININILYSNNFKKM